MPMACRSREGDLPAAGVAEDDAGQAETEEGDPADRLPGADGLLVASGVPGRGLRKLSGTSVGSSSRSWPSNSSRWASALAHPDAGHRSTAPSRGPAPAGRCRPALPRCGWSPRWRRTTWRSRGCGCSGGRRRRPAGSLVVGQDAGADGHVQPGLVADQRDQLQDAAQGSFVGPPDGQHDAELGRAQASVSRAAPRTSSVSRNGVALTGVSNRDDWEQKWQSSGQPPVLADRMPSTSTSGPHQASRTWWARAASEVTHSVGQLGQGARARRRRAGGARRAGRSRRRPARGPLWSRSRDARLGAVGAG